MSRGKFDYKILKNGKQIHTCRSIKSVCAELNNIFESDIYTTDKVHNYFTRKPKNQRGFKSIELIRNKIEKKINTQINNEA